MYKIINTNADITSFDALKKKEVFWEGKLYELTLKNHPQTEKLKKTVKSNLDEIQHELKTLYPDSESDDIVENWLSEQAQLLAIDFWNEVHQNKESFIYNSLIRGYSCHITDTFDGSKHNYPNGGFAVWEGLPSEKGSRLVAHTIATPPIDSRTLYIINGGKELPAFYHTQMHDNYFWSFISYFYRSLRKSNIIFSNLLMVKADCDSFQLEIL